MVTDTHLFRYRLSEAEAEHVKEAYCAGPRSKALHEQVMVRLCAACASDSTTDARGRCSAQDVVQRLLSSDACGQLPEAMQIVKHASDERLVTFHLDAGTATSRKGAVASCDSLLFDSVRELHLECCASLLEVPPLMSWHALTQHRSHTLEACEQVAVLRARRWTTRVLCVQVASVPRPQLAASLSLAPLSLRACEIKRNF